MYAGRVVASGGVGGNMPLEFNLDYSPSSSITSDTAGFSAPYPWDFSAQVLPPGAASLSNNQDPFVPDSFSDPCYPIYGDSYNTCMAATGDMAAVQEISTWDLDTIKEVAVSLDASIRNGCPVMWEEDTSAKGVANASERLCWLGSDEKVLPSTSDGAQAVAPGGKRGHCRKQKMHQLERQDDPDMERRRKNAVKQHNKRERDKKHQNDLESTLAHNTHRVSALNQEKHRRQLTISMFEEFLARNSIAELTPNQHGHFQ